MASYSQTFEGGSNGTTISNVNTDLSTVTIGGAGTTLTFDNAVARETLSAKYVMDPTTPTATTVQKLGVLADTAAACYFRFYVYKTWTTVSTWFDAMRVLDSASARVCQIGVRSDNLLRVGIGSSEVEVTTLRGTTQAVPQNQWFRIELKVIPSTTVGQIEWRLYTTDPDAAVGSFDETKSETGLALASGAVDGARWGVGTTVTNLANQTFYLDNLAMSDVDWIGPASTVPPTPGPKLRTIQSNLRLA